MFPTMWSSLDKNKTPALVEINKIQSFIFCKWLAGNPKTIFTANEFNMYSQIPMENQYFSIKHKYAGTIRNIKYVKSEKDDIDTTSLEQHFKISKEKAKEYLELISAEELEYITNLYKQKK